MLNFQLRRTQMTNRDEVDLAMIEAAEEFWKEVEEEASKYEVTVDYYLAEFY